LIDYVPYVTAAFYLILFNITNTIRKILGMSWVMTDRSYTWPLLSGYPIGFDNKDAFRNEVENLTIEQ